VGLGLHGYDSLLGAEAISLATACLGVPVRLNRLRASSISSTLQGMGTHLADLYVEATTSLKPEEAVFEEEGVKSGRPLALLEYEGDEFKSLPEKIATLDPDSVCGAKLSFTWIHSKGKDIGLWLLDSTSVLPGHARNLRLCIFRLHAEQQALKIVLQEIIQGRIQYKRSTPSGDRLEDYLNDATRMISKEKWKGISQEAIRSAIGAYDEVVSKGETALLMKQLEGVRLQIRRKVEEYAKERELPPRAVNVVVHGDVYQAETVVKEAHSMKIIKTEIGGGNVFHGDVVTAESIKGSFNRAAQSAKAPDLATALKNLTQVVGKLCEKLPPTEARAKARDLDTLVREATSEEPRPAEVKRLGGGLVEAAKTVAELIGPITTAVQVVMTWFGS
jgi:hypothetical protein